MKIMKILEYHTRIMKTMKILEFCVIIMSKHENLRIPHENYETYEKHIISIMKIIDSNLRIAKTMNIFEIHAI